MTIKPEVRTRVIELHLQGMKRDDIQRDVGNISTGSIHNILASYKSSGTGGGGNGSIADVTTNVDTVKAQEQTSFDDNTTYTNDNIIDTTGPSFNTNKTSWSGQAVPSNSNLNSPLANWPVSFKNAKTGAANTHE
jgi:hypothetical protein